MNVVDAGRTIPLKQLPRNSRELLFIIVIAVLPLFLGGRDGIVGLAV